MHRFSKASFENALHARASDVHVYLDVCAGLPLPACAVDTRAMGAACRNEWQLQLCNRIPPLGRWACCLLGVRPCNARSGTETIPAHHLRSKVTAHRGPANERLVAAAAAAALLPRRAVQSSCRHAADVIRSSKPSRPSLLSSCNIPCRI